MTTIILTANDQLLSVSVRPVLSCGDCNTVELLVEFSKEWDDLAKSATFYTSNDETVYEAVMAEDKCKVPWEVLSEPGTLFIGIRGVDSEDVEIKTSTEVKLKVLKGAARSNNSTILPSPDVYDQLMTLANETREIAQSVRDDADSGVLIPKSGLVPAPATCTTGKYLRVLEVDANGQITKTEPIDLEATIKLLVDEDVKIDKEIFTILEQLQALQENAAKELPEVSAADNNKVLKVVGGVWSAANETIPEEKKELPDVSASDNDKVLKVVNGKWSVDTDEVGGGVSSWNDLTDKPFYEDGGETVIFPEKELSFAVNPSFVCYAHSVSSSPFVFEDGQEYTIVWDTGTYTRTAFAFTAADGAKCVAVGNPVAAGQTANSDSFAIVCDKTNGYVHFLSLETISSHKVAISQGGNAVWKLNAECIPMDAIDARIEEKLAAIPDVSEVGM